MTQTSGGLVKRSVQFLPAQFAWLRAQAASKGQTSIAAVIRELIDGAMAAEQAPKRRAS